MYSLYSCRLRPLTRDRLYYFNILIILLWRNYIRIAENSVMYYRVPI